MSNAARRLVRVALASSPAPERVLLALRDDARPFALIGDWAGGGALVGSEPVRVLGAGEDPFAVLDEQPTIADATTGAVGGAWVGWLGYGLAGLVERVGPAPPRPVEVPAASLAFYDHLLRLDADGRWWFEALWSDAPEDDARLTRRLARLRAAVEHDGDEDPRPFAIGPVTTSPSGAGHAAAVRRCREHIVAGDLYQANLTLRLGAAFAGEAIDLFASTASTLRPARGAYVGDPRAQVASLSPELFLERRGRAVRTAPIKGTVARTGDPAERAALTHSAKDAAEHVMIVDLMRNDLGRVCAYGTVEAPSAPRAEEHPGVWHLVSDVTGRLRDDVGDAELLRATFPPGSVTGAPKVKALEVISELESTAREVYTGAIGFASPLAGLELSVAIRTFEVASGRVWLGAGGGIVADSDPAGELAEALVKARPLLAAAGAALRNEPAPAATTSPPPTRLRRPDPAAGVLETLLALDGRVVEVQAHVDRVGASVAAVYGRALDPADLLDTIAAAAASTRGAARVRVVATAGGTAVDVLPVPFERLLPAGAATLVALTLPGGAGRHKWADRALLDGAPDGGEHLVVDLDGTVLESGRGNVWIAEGDVLVTPPADGRLLDGVTRRVLLDVLPGAREERITLDRLARADAVLLSSAIRVLQPAHLPGRSAPSLPPVATRAATLLAGRWGLPVAQAA